MIDLVEDGGMLRVDVFNERCGRSFEGVAHIIEPDSDNPLIAVARPLGVSAVREILDALERRRESRSCG